MIIADHLPTPAPVIQQSLKEPRVYLEHSNDAIDRRFATGQKAIRKAGALALAYFDRRDALTVETKADPQDVVSIADREVETALRTAIRHAHPDDGFLGEEHGAEPGDNDVLWVIDPIDGTSCFLAGLNSWCLSVALLVGGKLAFGLVYDPNADELFSALVGRGAELNGNPIRTGSATALADGLLGVGMSHRVDAAELLPFLGRLLNAGGMFFRNGSCAMMMAYAAAGRLIGYYEPHINAWDCLAGMVLIKEAGGWTSPFLDATALTEGNPIIAAATPKLGSRLQNML